MMQEDSNGESTFEIVDKKMEEFNLSDNTAVTPETTSAGSSSVAPQQTHSVVPPPSELPSFIKSQTQKDEPVSTTQTYSPPQAPAQIYPPPQTYAPPQTYTPPQTYAPPQTVAPPQTYAPSQTFAPPFQYTSSQMFRPLASVQTPIPTATAPVIPPATRLPPPTIPMPPVSFSATAATPPQTNPYRGGMPHRPHPVGIATAVPPPPLQPAFTAGAMPAEKAPLYSSSSPSISIDTSTGPDSYSRPQLTPSSTEQGGGLFGWFKGSMVGGNLLSKVAEKAKNSVDSMITTLDPQMKEFIYSGGDIDVVVASDKEIKISPIREAFQSVFGHATVTGVSSQALAIAAQPVGFAAGVKGAEERIQHLRDNGLVHQMQPVVAIENFLVELTQDRWYDIGCLVLSDERNSLLLHSYTQATPVPSHYVAQMQEETSSDYPLRWSGLGVTVGQVAARNLQVHHSEWHSALTGVSRRDLLLLAAKSLAGLYKGAVGSH